MKAGIICPNSHVVSGANWGQGNCQSLKSQKLVAKKFLQSFQLNLLILEGENLPEAAPPHVPSVSGKIFEIDNILMCL